MAFEPNKLSGHKISTDNSTSSLLASGVTYTGTWEDVTAYSTTAVTILGSMVSSGTLYFDLSTNGGTTYTSVPRTLSDLTFELPRILNIVESHIRIRYVNGDTAQTGTWSLQTKHSNGQQLGLLQKASDSITDETDVQNTRSLATGKNPNNDYDNTKIAGVCNENSSTTNLTAGTSLVFTGMWADISQYAGLSVLVDGTASGTVGGSLQMQLSHDGVTIHRNITVSNTDITNVPPRTLGVVTKYFRIVYTADSDLTSFDVQTMFHTEQVSLVSRLDQTLQGTEDVANVRSVVVGQTYGGTFKNVPVNADGNVKVDLPLTAFGDLRTAELSPIFQVSFEYTVDNTEIGTADNAASGTTTQADAMCVVSTVGSTSGSHAQWRSSRNAKYRAGLGGLFRCTAMFTAGVSGTEQAIGLMDEDGVSASHRNGYAVGYNGTDFGFFRWSNDSLNFVNLSSWNDPLDGTGDSGITLDPTKLNVYFIDFQYLGAGAIKIWIEHPTTGNMILAHTVAYSNLNSVPSIQNPNLHMNLHIQNGATTANITAKSASMAFFVEGKTKHTELQQPHFSSDKVETASVTTEVALFTIRNKSTYASKNNFIDIVLQHMSTAIEAGATNNLGFVKLVKNATLGGSPSYSDIDATDSVIEIDTSGTTVTGGISLIGTSLAGKNDKHSESLADYDFILSPGETITFAGSSANSATIHADLLWKELF